jgi:hypothetical protein
MKAAQALLALHAATPSQRLIADQTAKLLTGLRKLSTVLHCSSECPPARELIASPCR